MNNVSQVMILILLSCMALHAAADAKQEKCSEAVQKECVQKSANAAFPEFPFGLTLDELNDACTNLDSGFKCLENYAKNCLSESRQEDFTSGTKNIRDLVNALCNPGPYKADFLKHYGCLKTTVPQVKTCLNRYNQMVLALNALSQQDYNTNIEQSFHEYTKKICCHYQTYQSCVGQAANTCGDSASSFLTGFLNKLTGVAMAYICSGVAIETCNNLSTLPGSA